MEASPAENPVRAYEESIFKPFMIQLGGSECSGRMLAAGLKLPTNYVFGFEPARIFTMDRITIDTTFDFRTDATGPDQKKVRGTGSDLQSCNTMTFCAASGDSRESRRRNPNGIRNIAREARGLIREFMKGSTTRLKRLNCFVFLIFVVITLSLSATAFASPLVYKATKEVTSDKYVEVGAFDATRFHSIRVGFVFSTKDGSSPVIFEYAQSQYTSQSLDFIRVKRRSSPDSDEYKKADAEAKGWETAMRNAFSAQLVGVVGNDKFALFTPQQKDMGSTILIDNPPSNIQFVARGNGVVTIYVWGS